MAPALFIASPRTLLAASITTLPSGGGQRIVAWRAERTVQHGDETEVASLSPIQGQDAGAFFEEEFLAIVEWELALSDWDAINQPVLSVLGEHSLQFFAEGRPTLHTCLPQTEDFDLFNATHLLQIENPEGMASGLLSFFARHPLHGPVSRAPGAGRR